MIIDIVTNQQKCVQNYKKYIERERILLIDEIDVFFSKEFFGNTYTSQASLKDPTITALIEHIWSLRKYELSVSMVKQSQ